MRKITKEEVERRLRRAENAGAVEDFVTCARGLLKATDRLDEEDTWGLNSSLWAINMAIRWYNGDEHGRAKTCLVFAQMLLDKQLHRMYSSLFNSSGMLKQGMAAIEEMFEGLTGTPDVLDKCDDEACPICGGHHPKTMIPLGIVHAVPKSKKKGPSKLPDPPNDPRLN